MNQSQKNNTELPGGNFLPDDSASDGSLQDFPLLQEIEDFIDTVFIDGESVVIKQEIANAHFRTLLEFVDDVPGRPGSPG